ncbi:MAG TPA: ribonuclease Y [Candidatus Baltobacteraceae bacterium]|nr:ribonuclease Y [Candidatus Baltobacteraceae bacterium]
MLIFAAAVAALLAGVLGGRIVERRRQTRLKQEAAEEVKRLLREAEREADAKRKEADLEIKDKALRARTEIEQELRTRREEVLNFEKRLGQREEILDRKLEVMDRRERELSGHEQELRNREQAVGNEEGRWRQLVAEAQQQLERVAGLTSEQAKAQLLQALEEEAKLHAAQIIKRIEDTANETGEERAKHIIGRAICRIASEYVAEAAVSVVDLPSDDMKGRIIGREGRNIRALEKATGIDIIVDDTPETIILSGFDSIRREIARVAIQRLIQDGRIHPARIEETVEKVTKEVEKDIREAGEQACFELGITGLHPELVRMVGRLKYRYSYSQNQLAHTKEVATLAGLLAAELKLDAKAVKRAALLHDIGKAADQGSETSHALLSAELAKKYNEDPRVINIIAAHHEEVAPQYPEAVLLQAADTLSAARPGARREIMETYVRRLAKLEEIATSFKGVEKCFAIQAGREVRVVVESEQVNDQAAYVMARDIAKRIEEEMEYPGQIKVTVIRETRAVEYAR